MILTFLSFLNASDFILEAVVGRITFPVSDSQFLKHPSGIVFTVVVEISMFLTELHPSNAPGSIVDVLARSAVSVASVASPTYEDPTALPLPARHSTILSVPSPFDTES